MIGVIKTFSNGAGFIHSFQDRYYFNSSDLMVPAGSIGPGVPVDFEIKETLQGPQAVKIKPRNQGNQRTRINGQKVNSQKVNSQRNTA